MRTKTRTHDRRRGLQALSAILLTIFVASPAIAQDMDRDRDRDRVDVGDTEPDRDQERLRDRVRDRLKDEVGLTNEELEGLAPTIREYARRQGDPAVVARVAREAKQAGCTGACLGETVRTMNRAMAQGMDSSAAGEMTQALVREQTRARSGESEQRLATQLRTRATARLRERLRESEDAGRGDLERARRESQREQREAVGAGPDGMGGDAGGRR